MLIKIAWKENTVLNVQLTSSLYTLAQMRIAGLLQFFKVKSIDGKWRDIDLNNVSPLFCIKVAEKRLKPLLSETLPVNVVTPNRRPPPCRMLRYRFGNEGKHSADLVELSGDFDSLSAKVIKSNLTMRDDLREIYEHEYVGIEGNPEKLRKRLIAYFETGINWDESKSLIFPGISPPPADHVAKLL